MKYNYEEYALFFKALSDDIRLKILSMLTDKELCACKILEEFNITQPTLSYHMKILVDTGIVNAVKDGSWVRYSINEDKKEEVLKFFSYLLKENCSCRKGE
jgi:ArsR family transcriptional regulator, arsenate/arsenite/antimonite-responsive transcriptional repressor